MDKRRTTTSSAVKRRYNEKAYDRIEASIPKGSKELFKAKAAESGTNPNALINKWVKEYLEGER